MTASTPKNIPAITYYPFTQMTKNVTVTGTPNKTMSFEYSADNERILKSESYGTTQNSNYYIRGNNDYPITEKTNTNNTLNDKIYIYGPTGLIAVKDGYFTYFVIKDHLGSVRILFDPGGYAVATYDYSPFGTLMRETGNVDVVYKFTGQEYDSETALYNFRARLYDDEIGIFYAVDPSGQNFSPYSYAGNNPVLYIDKDGRIFGIDDLLFIGILATVGGYTGGAIANQNLNPFQWNWNSSNTWKGIGIGALSGAFIGSGIVVGGTYGVAVGNSVANTIFSGTSSGDWWKSALVGFASGYVGATGAFGWVKEGELLKKLAVQAGLSTFNSIGNNWARGDELFSDVRIGLGPVTFNVGKGQRLLNLGNNWFNAGVYSLGFLNLLTGGSVDWEPNSLSLNFKGGVTSWFINNVLGAQAWANGTMFNASGNYLVGHEGTHVWQSRFFGNPNFSFDYLFSTFQSFLMDPYASTSIFHSRFFRAYYYNFFEQQAEATLWR
jgi:RHS repeat-associated protein